MTDTSPFRRFPWVQLVFCVACLSMAAWTWMRYSYAWDVDIRLFQDSGASHPKNEPRFADRYVRIVGLDEVKKLWSPNGPRGSALLCYAVADDYLTGRLSVEYGSGHPLDRPTTDSTQHLQLKELVGRFRRYEYVSLGKKFFTLDAAASRFHPASIAGLVVGAMGCFIFGLYLRGWLRERKALASQPEQDMIA